MTAKAVTPKGDPLENEDGDEGDYLPGRQRMTLEALGPTLPLGVLSGEERARDMTMKPWRMKEERELGVLRDKHKKLGLSGYVGIVIATMFEQLGGVDFSSMKKIEDKLLRVSQMAIGDVLYAYTFLRREAIGNEFKMTIPCGSCGESFGFVADLGSMDVTTCNDANKEKWTYNLLHPFETRDTKVETLTLREPVWDALKSLRRGANVGSAKAGVLHSSIIGFTGFKMQLTQAELDLLSKRDLEDLLDQINDRGVGPELKIEEDCPHCGSDVVTSVDWGYDNFFASSSN